MTNGLVLLGQFALMFYFEKSVQPHFVRKLRYKWKMVLWEPPYLSAKLCRHTCLVLNKHGLTAEQFLSLPFTRSWGCSVLLLGLGLSHVLCGL